MVTSFCTRLLTGLLLALLLAGAAAERADAHASFVEAAPAAGGRVESTPSEVTLTFTEPLNDRLTRVEILTASSGEKVPTSPVKTSRSGLSVRPASDLTDGAYVVRWFSVSTEDGHALEGSYSFGVRAPATAVAHSVEQSPLARGGWVRIALRGGLYVTILLFVAALLLPRLLGGDANWLAPAEMGSDPSILERRRRAGALVSGTGWLAVIAAVGTTLAEATDAAGSLAPQALADFLLVGAAGPARLAVVLLLVGAVVAHARLSRLAAGLGALALGAIAASGHAGSVSPRAPSILNDWVHLLSGALWLGGIGLIGLVWASELRREGIGRRRDVARWVLVPFGRVALPAFVLVTATGLVSLLVQLGELSALWQTDYGRLLAAKITVVALIATASAWHAWLLRPKLLAGTHHGKELPWERRHWRLVRIEPVLGLGVVAIVGALVVFPLPPSQLGELDEARAATPSCDPCPLAKAKPDELPVATRVGDVLVAGWIRRAPSEVTGTVRVYDQAGRPARVAPRIREARQAGCGVGCVRFRLQPESTDLEVTVSDRGRSFVAELPTRWDDAANARARRLLTRTESTMRRLRSVRQVEEVTSGPGSFARTTYRLQAPDRMTFRTDRGVETVVAGSRQWFRAGPGPYTVDASGAGLPFRTRSWFRWSVFGRTVRLLGTREVDGRRVADLALYDEATPAWIRLAVNLKTHRVLSEVSVSKNHLSRSRYNAFDRATAVRLPKDGR